jgi:hypothetical protein
MNTSTIHTLVVRNDAELNFMIFAFGYFLVRLLTKQLIDESDCNENIRAINAARSSKEILDATFRKENSLWQRIYIGHEGDLILLDSDDQVPKAYIQLYGNYFEDLGIQLRSYCILAHIMRCLCYGSMGLPTKSRELYKQNAVGSNRKIAMLVNAWRNSNVNELKAVTLPIFTGLRDVATSVNLKQVALKGPQLKDEDDRYLYILEQFITAEQQQRKQLYKKIIFIFAFAGLVILSLAIIAAANIISWANLIKIALLSSIAAKAGIAAAGIVIGGVLLFLANRLRYKKNIFGCPCDEFCRGRCVREENSEEELLAHSKGITQ